MNYTNFYTRWFRRYGFCSKKPRLCIGGRYMDRTCDPCSVNANAPLWPARFHWELACSAGPCGPCKHTRFTPSSDTVRKSSLSQDWQAPTLHCAISHAFLLFPREPRLASRGNAAEMASSFLASGRADAANGRMSSPHPQKRCAYWQAGARSCRRNRRNRAFVVMVV